MDSWSSFATLALGGAFLIAILQYLQSVFWPKQLYPNPAALHAIRRMSEDEQRYFQRLVIAKSKIEAIKELRSRANLGLKESKDAIELLQAVEPAILKFD